MTHNDHDLKYLHSLVIQKRKLMNDRDLPMVTCLCVSNKPRMWQTIIDTFKDFTDGYPNGREQLELIIIGNTGSDNYLYWEDLNKYGLRIRYIWINAKHTLGFCLNLGFDQSHVNSKYIFKIDDDDIYGKFYLFDSVCDLEISKAHLIAKSSGYVTFPQMQITGLLMRLPLLTLNKPMNSPQHVFGGTIGYRKDINIRFKNVNSGEDVAFIKDSYKNHLKIFISDPFNYLYVRNINQKLHTYQMNYKTFIKDLHIFKTNNIIHHIII